MEKKHIQNYYNERWKGESKKASQPGKRWKYQKSRIDNALINWIESIKPEQILEVGMGKGDLARKLVDYPYIDSYTGIDISQEGVKIAQNMVKNPKFNFLVSDCTDLPFLEEFDMVIFSEVMEHVEEKQKAIDEIFRVLKPGGHLILTTPNPDSISYTLPRLWGKFKPNHHYGSKQIINQLINKKTLINHVKKSGFNIMDYRGLVFQPYSISLLENNFKSTFHFWRKISQYLENKDIFPEKALYQVILAKKD